MENGESFQKRITNPTNETLLFCTFNGRQCKDSELSWYYHRRFGRCLRFNAENKVSNSGISNGLNIELLLEAVDEDTISKNEGVQILINNFTLESVYSDDPILASAKKITNIAISRKYKDRLGRPYNECILEGEYVDSDFYNAIIERSDTYKQR